MKALFSLCLTLFLAAPQLSSAQKFPKLDKSPHDVALLKKKGDAVAKVLYGRPQKNDREIFGKLVKFGKVWRTGANECTEIIFYQDVVLNGQTVKAGTYALFTIPNENEWTIILNRDLNKWGAYFYKEANDLLRFTVKTDTSKEVIEAFSITFDTTKTGADLVLGWDQTIVRIPMSF